MVNTVGDLHIKLWLLILIGQSVVTMLQGIKTTPRHNFLQLLEKIE